MALSALARRVWSGLKPWLIWFVFFLIGPLCGLLVVIGIGAVRGLLERGAEAIWPLPAPPSLVSLDAAALLYGFSLLYGGLQSAFVGVVALLTYVARGRVSFWPVMAAAALAAAGFLLVVMTAMAREGKTMDGVTAAFLIVPHLVAAASCWLIVSDWRREIVLVKAES